MSYPKKLLRLKPTKGAAPDLPANEVGPDYYTGVGNAQFREGFAGRILGSRAAYGTLPTPVFHLQNVRVDTTNFWIVYGADEIHALETTNATDITGVALSAASEPFQWSSALLNGIPCATNGLDAPRYWPGNVSNPFVDLPGWPAGTSCKSLAAFQFHLVALDIDGPSGHFENQIKWSDAAEPGAVPATWVPAADNEAGDAILADKQGPNMVALSLRGSLAIYKRNSIYTMDYVGGNDVFSFRQVISSAGALTRHAVADLSDGRHFVVGDGDIYVTDLVGRQSIAQDRVKHFLFDQLDQDFYENLFVTYHRAKNEIWVCFPEQGAHFCTLALIYDVAHDSWGVRELQDVSCAAIGIVNDTAPSETWDAATYLWADADALRLWNQANFSLAVESIVTGSGTTMKQHDTSDATSVAASLSRYDLTFDQPERVKFVKRVHVRASTGYGTLYVRVGSRMTPSDTISWSSEYSLIEPNQVVHTFTQGRYISVEIRSDGDAVWQISGIELEAEVRGYR